MLTKQASWAAGSGAQVAMFGLCMFASSVFIMYRAERILEVNQEQIRQLQHQLVAIAAQRHSYNIGGNQCLPLAHGEELMAGACPNPSLVDADGEAEDGAAGSALDSAFRIVVGVALVAVLAVAFLVLQNLDRLPKWLNDALHHAMGFGGGSEGPRSKDSEVTNEVPLSKLIAYRLDRWFSTNPYAKVSCHPSRSRHK